MVRYEEKVCQQCGCDTFRVVVEIELCETDDGSGFMEYRDGHRETQLRCSDCSATVRMVEFNPEPFKLETKGRKA